VKWRQVGPHEVAPDPETLRPDRADDAWSGGVLTNYLWRWNGEYFGYLSEGSPFLKISRETVLNGEINSCDLLIVEGRVEATMKACREIRIVPTGTVRGRVEFDRADIGGVFEGDLTARERLVVRASGSVTGKVRAGEIEIERGGQVTGDVQIIR
jgi:cytoskeletal protein CcmA (bactofilin family)